MSTTRNVHRKYQWATATALALLLVLAAAPSHAEKSALKQAALAAYEEFAKTSFVAKVDLPNFAHFYVQPDGSPSTRKAGKQGKGGGGGMFAKNVKVRSGETGRGIYVSAKKNTATVQVTKNARGINGTWIHILYDRPVTPADLEPAKLARAVSSLVVIRGYEPGAEIDEALDEVLGDLASSPPAGGARAARPAPSVPEILDLYVTLEPSVLRPGATLQIRLDYQVSAANGTEVAVREERGLSFLGEVLPGFPAADNVRRAAGPHRSDYLQPIPAGAQAGAYQLEVSVCIQEHCTTRSAAFEIRR